MTVITERAAIELPLPAFAQEELFPIREVSRLTGVNPVTLRAWERRYGLIQPTRTESGHRLYAMSDIETVRSILGWIERGVAVSKVGKLLAKSAAVRVLASDRPLPFLHEDWSNCQSQLCSAVGNFDELALERLYGQIFSSYPLTVVFQNILMPLWQELRGQRGNFGHTSEWLFLDSFLRGRVLQRLQSVRGIASQLIFLAALPGDCRELELLVAGLLLGNGECPVSVLAIGQPLDELPLICEKARPRALVLYSNRSPASDMPRRLNRLALAVECPLMLAGDVSDVLQDALEGSSIGCLGHEGQSMRQRLLQLLSGRLDT